MNDTVHNRSYGQICSNKCFLVILHVLVLAETTKEEHFWVLVEEKSGMNMRLSVQAEIK